MYLGIDGGGTKTDFKVVDQSGAELARLTLPKGCKPTYYGTEAAIDVLREGIKHLQEKLPGDFTAIYAGIPGCNTPTKAHKPITTLLSWFAPVYKLGGDLVTSFRAGSTNPSGVLLLAGSGSGIAHWYPGGSVHLDGVCYGAREIIFLLSNAYARQDFGPQTKKVLEEQIGKDVLGKDAHFFLTQQIPMEALKSLTDTAVPAEAWEELKKIYDIVVERWAYKAVGRIMWQQSTTNDEAVEAVLAGGVWNFAYLRDNVIKAVQQSLGPSVQLIYRPDRAPVDGAVDLARALTPPAQ